MLDVDRQTRKTKEDTIHQHDEYWWIFWTVSLWWHNDILMQNHKCHSIYWWADLNYRKYNSLIQPTISILMQQSVGRHKMSEKGRIPLTHRGSERSVTGRCIFEIRQQGRDETEDKHASIHIQMNVCSLDGDDEICGCSPKLEQEDKQFNNMIWTNMNYFPIDFNSLYEVLFPWPFQHTEALTGTGVPKCGYGYLGILWYRHPGIGYKYIPLHEYLGTHAWVPTP